MQLEIHLYTSDEVRLPFSYFHSLSSAVYRVLGQRAPCLSAELHNGEKLANRIKLFGLTPISEVHQSRTASSSAGSKSCLHFSGLCSFHVFTPLTDLAYEIAQALNESNYLELDGWRFEIRGVMIARDPKFDSTMCWRPYRGASIVTAWTERAANQRKIYRVPGVEIDGGVYPSIEQLLVGNLLHKWKRLSEVAPSVAERWTGLAISEARSAFTEDSLRANIIPLRVFTDSAAGIAEDRLIKPRYHTIKSAPVKSWRANVVLEAPIPLQRLVWASGLGQMNGVCFGGVNSARLPERII